MLVTILAHATEGSIQTSVLWSADAARIGLLYWVAWCAMVIALVIFDWRVWRSVPVPAASSPTYGAEHRVR